eukprot:CAMPEP_0205998772 /NCGR_PEP_ID=MMETSP1464-20131121/433_1 /ASSEMBLY_ACC=CAM_ASM_001124 /TAXON_ID=119497 /ORGANISM="Exanthemachrysis gayraliae, Strain RCC1523" /LENGTH=239 /DNA_ID=CAMNT_0053371927 /DNA_START=171 /DNA_END=886 /DNA_ORIENTATION=+
MCRPCRARRARGRPTVRALYAAMWVARRRARLDGGRDARRGARDKVARDERGPGHHGRAAVLQLLELHHAVLLLGHALGQAERVEAQVARLAAAAALPHLVWVGEALDDADREEDLGEARRVLRGEGAEGVEPVLLGEGRGREVRGEGLHQDADKGQHANAAVLELRLPEPLEVGVGVRAVLLSGELAELGQAHGVPRLAAEELRGGAREVVEGGHARRGAAGGGCPQRRAREREGGDG